MLLPSRSFSSLNIKNINIKKHTNLFLDKYHNKYCHTLNQILKKVPICDNYKTNIKKILDKSNKYLYCPEKKFINYKSLVKLFIINHSLLENNIINDNKYEYFFRKISSVILEKNKKKFFRKIKVVTIHIQVHILYGDNINQDLQNVLYQLEYNADNIWDKPLYYGTVLDMFRRYLGKNINNNIYISPRTRSIGIQAKNIISKLLVGENKIKYVCPKISFLIFLISQWRNFTIEELNKFISSMESVYINKIIVSHKLNKNKLFYKMIFTIL